MKKTTVFRWGFLYGLLIIVLMACGSTDLYSGNDMATEDMAVTNDMDAGVAEQVAEEKGLDLGEKIIETASVSYEAMDFDETLAFVQDEIEAFQAQIEFSSRWQSTSSYGFIGERISMNVRVPQDQLHAFVDTLNAYDDLVIQHQDFQRADVTREYRDNATRIEILKEEETILREMLQEQGSLEEILQIRTRLSELVTEREIYENQNRAYDEQIAYSTLHLEIQETDRANSRDTRGFWDRITNAIVDSFYRFIAVGQNLVITIIYLIPYLLILAVTGGIAFYIIRKRKGKKTKL